MDPIQLAKINNPKKLKKVEEFRKKIKELKDDINTAYSNKNDFEIDQACTNMFTFLDSLNIPIEDDFYTKIRNHTWQKNHLRIIAYISDLMQENNRMPTNTEISIAS
jgi:hypothetical protein